jgi:hypothetical protein
MNDFKSVFVQEWCDLHIIKTWPFPAAELPMRGFPITCSPFQEKMKRYICLFSYDTPTSIVNHVGENVVISFVWDGHLPKKFRGALNRSIETVIEHVKTEYALVGKSNPLCYWRHPRGSLHRISIHFGAEVIHSQVFVVRARS